MRLLASNPGTARSDGWGLLNMVDTGGGMAISPSSRRTRWAGVATTVVMKSVATRRRLKECILYMIDQQIWKLFL